MALALGWHGGGRQQRNKRWRARSALVSISSNGVKYQLMAISSGVISSMAYQLYQCQSVYVVIMALNVNIQ
jgi:hypothetical protein